MFGLGNNDDEERFWNFVMFKMWATDEELDAIAPVFVIIGLLALLAWWIFG